MRILSSLAMFANIAAAYSTDAVNTATIAASGTHTHTLIFLHHLGGTAEAYEERFTCPDGDMCIEGLKVFLP